MEKEEKEDGKKEESDEKKKITQEDKENQGKDSDRRRDREVIWLITILTIIILSFFSTIWISQEAKKFDYEGYMFTKEKFGDIPIYSTIITGYNQEGAPINFKLNLRNDPRELDVPFNGNLSFIEGKPLYFSINITSDIHECGSLALVSLGQFMNGIGKKMVTGITTQEEANQYKKLHINCDNAKDATTVVLTKGDKTEIIQSESNPQCYVLKVNNCEIIEAIERFEIETLKEIK